MSGGQRHTALVLVDVIKAFFHPEGSTYYPAAEKVLDPIAALLDRARERDALVVHAAERHRPGLADFENRHLPAHNRIGDADAEFADGFAPQARVREVEVGKRRFSAFYATDLDLLLREQGIDEVVVAGVKTNVCIRATIQDAFAGGFAVVLPREATNSNRPHLEEASLEDIERYFGTVTSIDDALERL